MISSREKLRERAEASAELLAQEFDFAGHSFFIFLPEVAASKARYFREKVIFFSGVSHYHGLLLANHHADKGCDLDRSS